jgi:hypothetical protein
LAKLAILKILSGYFTIEYLTLAKLVIGLTLNLLEMVIYPQKPIFGWLIILKKKD